MLTEEQKRINGPNTRWFPKEQEPAPIVIGEAMPLSHPAESAFVAQPGGDEMATPVSRARGLTLRMAPLLAISLAVSVALVALVFRNPIENWPMVLLAWGVFSLAAWHFADRREYQFSRNGLERHRADLAASLYAQDSRQQYELRRRQLDYYLHELEQRNGN